MPINVIINLCQFTQIENEFYLILFIKDGENMKKVIKILGFIFILILCINKKSTNVKGLVDNNKEVNIPQICITTSSNIGYGEYTKVNISVDGINNEGKIKIRGNSTMWADKKAYKIKFNKKQDVLGMGKAKKWVLLANAYDKTLMRNKLIFDFGSNLNFEYTPKSKYVDLYINGVYKGDYLLVEPVEVNKNRLNINTDNGDCLLEVESCRVDKDTSYITTNLGIRLGINEPEKADNEKMERILQYLNNFEEDIVNYDYESYKNYVDLKSFVDFYITNEYFKNYDIRNSSTRFYIKQGILYAGPLWDYDLSCGNLNDYYMHYNNMNTSGLSYEGLYVRLLKWFEYLTNDEKFMELVKERYKELQPKIQNLYEDNSLGENQIDNLYRTNYSSFVRNYSETGYKVNYAYYHLERVPDDTLEENVEYLRDWLRKRNDWLIDTFGIEDVNSYKYIAKKSLENQIDMTKYTDLQKIKIQKVIDKLKLEINCANSNEEVDQIVNKLQNEIDKALRDNIDLNKSKKDSKNEIQLYKDQVKFKEKQEEKIDSVIETGNNEIDNAIDEDEIKIRVRQVKAKINAIIESGDINKYYVNFFVMIISLYLMKRYKVRNAQ